MNFTRIDYLAQGTNRQQQVFSVLTSYSIINQLAFYSPVLAGTIPLDIDVAGSDLDIICCWQDKSAFKKHVQQCFGSYNKFCLVEKYIRSELTVLVNFEVENFPVEIFGQNKATTQQLAYQHLIIEHGILAFKGSLFKEEIKKLKQQGIKTEPAFAQLLGLTGNPYQQLIQYGLKAGFLPESNFTSSY